MEETETAVGISHTTICVVPYVHIMNSFFKNKTQRRWTWQSPVRTTKNEIDFFTTKQRENVIDVTALNSFGVGRDHRAVIATVQINLKKERSKLMRTKKPIKWNLPENTSEYAKFINFAQNHDAISEVETINNNIIEAILISQRQN